MSEPIISVSGLRGIIGQELNPNVASNYVAAFCSTLPTGIVIVSRDGRASGPMLARSVIATAMAHGMRVLDADVLSTPSLGVLIRDQGAVGGIQISASHNPTEYNGLKLFNAQGRVIPAGDGQMVLDAYRERHTRWVSIDAIGTCHTPSNPHHPHLQAVLATVDVAHIAGQKFRVLLDSNHGAGSLLGKLLLDKLGCRFTVLGEVPDGRFAHPPEPLAINLGSVSQNMQAEAFDIGFCQDPDADRLAVIDENGVYVGEEYTSVLCAMHRLEQTKGAVVTNCASSSMTQWLAKKHGVPFFRSKVGEANVVDEMIRQSAVYGGEGSGGPIDPRVGFVRDSFVGMAQILDLMASRRRPISAIVAELPTGAMIKDKMQMSVETLAASIHALQSGMQSTSIDLQDGVRLDWNDRWLLLRGSNTEPIVRLIAEGPCEADARQLIDQAKEILASALK